MASLEQLNALFGATFSGDANERMRSELELRALEAQPGVLPAAWALVASDAPLAARQAAAIWVKNRTRRGWDTRSAAALAEPDKAQLKASILPALASLPPTLRVHAAATLHAVVSADWPSRWPQLVPWISTALHSTDEAQVAAGARALLVVVQSLRWRDEHALLDSLVAMLFPQLVVLARTLLAHPAAGTADVGDLLHVINKTFARSLSTQLVPHLQTAAAGALLQLYIDTVLLPTIAFAAVDEHTLPADIDERAAAPWWKAKKWAYVALNKLFLAYGDPAHLPSSKEQYKPFANDFLVLFAPRILEAYLREIERAVAGAYLSRYAQFAILKFLLAGIKTSALWALLKPHVEVVVERFAFPTLCLTVEDEARFQDEPSEFIRQQMDPVEVFGNPVSVACELVEAVAARRKASSFLPLVQFVQRMLSTSSSSFSHSLLREKEGALRMASAMRTTMVHDPVTGPELETFVVSHVLPALAGAPLLQFRGCELIKSFDQAGLVWTDAVLEQAFQGVLACLLESSALPVRVQAGAALGQLVRHDKVQAACAPHAGRLMHTLLAVSDETELDVLLKTQETMVTTFSEELLPVAVELATQLRDSLIRLVGQVVQAAQLAEQTGDLAAIPAGADDAMYASMAHLSTLYQLVSAAEENKPLVAQLEAVVLPAILVILEHERTELLDDLFDLLDILTFYQQRISPNLWKVYELMTRALLTWAADYVAEMVGTLDNFISFGSDTLLATPAYQHALLQVYVHQWERDADDDEVAAALKLADVALLNMPGGWDTTLSTWLEPAAQAVVARTASASKRRWADTAVLDTFIYNARLSLSLLGDRAGTLLDALLPRAVRAKRPHEMLAASLAFLALLSLERRDDDDAHADVVLARAPRLLSAIVTLLAQYPQALARSKALTDWLGDEDPEHTELTTEGDVADDQDVQDESDALHDLLVAAAEKRRTKDAWRAQDNDNNNNNNDGDNDDDDDDDNEEGDDEGDLDDDDAVFESPLGKYRVYELFQSWLTSHPAAAESLRAQLSPQLQSAFATVAATSDDEVAALSA